jgi:hypothetical protein
MLKTFINHLLSTIHHDNPLMDIPNTDCWGLKSNEDGFIDLDCWDPRQSSQDVYKVVTLPIIGDPRTLAPIPPHWAILGGVLSAGIKSIQLPTREIFQIGGSHLLLVIHCQYKVKVSKKKSRIEETKRSMLVPAGLKVVDLVEAFKRIGKVTGVFEIPATNDIQTNDTRTAADLGWKHGTELRLEMF